MMGTLAKLLAGKNIETPKDRYHAEVEGIIEDVDGVLKITRIHVNYILKVGGDQEKDAEAALAVYLPKCPGAASVMDCIEITHEITFVS